MTNTTPTVSSFLIGISRITYGFKLTLQSWSITIKTTQEKVVRLRFHLFLLRVIGSLIRFNSFENSLIHFKLQMLETGPFICWLLL